LLVVITIVSTLAAILLPVFAQAKESAKRAVCLSNVHQIAIATHEYVSDYDDRFMLISQHPTGLPSSRNDRTWVQLVLPYLHSFSIFQCPSDTSARPGTDSTFDQDVVPGDTDSRYYTASLRTNYGYNYLNLSPVIRVNGTWVAQPRTMSSVEAPSRTLMQVDSVWALTDGNPWGGGSWLVTPPCRYYNDPSSTDSFTGSPARYSAVLLKSYGWSSRTGDSTVYGNVWPWHGDYVNVARVDGSVANRRISDLTAGCDPQGAWQGRISDSESYLWDIR
jgi:prepilin-type processing-associated H-X9-DG protein